MVYHLTLKSYFNNLSFYECVVLTPRLSFLSILTFNQNKELEIQINIKNAGISPEKAIKILKFIYAITI